MSKLIIGNQKMYMDYDKVNDFIEMLKQNNLENVIVCPSFLFLNDYKNIVKTGAQNVSYNDNGPSTGEISSTQLKTFGINYCIVGHSERREFQKETDEDINKKLVKLLNQDITPILCIGEKLEERENNSTETVIKNELDIDLKDLSTEFVNKIIIAYEPIWAIGTGLTPTNEQIDEMMKMIKNYVSTNFNAQVKVLYGGSVSDKNVDELNTIDSVDGYLIGGASSKKDQFDYIIKSNK